jgi:hypothetical protein
MFQPAMLPSTGTTTKSQAQQQLQQPEWIVVLPRRGRFDQRQSQLILNRQHYSIIS